MDHNGTITVFYPHNPMREREREREREVLCKTFQMGRREPAKAKLKETKERGSHRKEMWEQKSTIWHHSSQ